MKRIGSWMSVVLLFALCHVALCGEIVELPESWKTVSIPKDGDYIVIPCEVCGAERDFLVDLGSDRAMLDEPLRVLLGAGSPGSLKMDFGRTNSTELFVTDLRFGGIKREGERVGIQRMAPLRQSTGLYVDGVFGHGMMECFTLEIDFDKGTLSFYQPFRPLLPFPGGQSLVYEKGHCVKAKIGSLTEVLMLVDTGSRDAVSISGRMFDELENSGNITQVKIDARGERRGRLSSISLVGFTLKNQPVTCRDRCAIGLRLLSRFRVIINLSIGEMILEPGARFDADDPDPWHGLYAKKIRGKIVVDRCEPDGPADAAHLCQRDVIISIAGHEVEHLSIFEFEHHPAWNSDQVETVVQRQSGKQTLILKKPAGDRGPAAAKPAAPKR